MRADRGLRADAPALLCVGAALAAALFVSGCSGGKEARPAPPPRARALPSPIFDQLDLGMTRAEAARAHSIRPSLTASGRNLRVWRYGRPGEYEVDLTFDGAAETARLRRIDVHFGPRDASYEEFVRQYAPGLGVPEVGRRRAAIDAYGGPRRDQYETVWSDEAQYVYLTEGVPAEGRRGPTVYYLSVKRKEIKAAGPPTGYVPPPPPKGKDGKPVEEAPF